jgi:hypothetical protein
MWTVFRALQVGLLASVMASSIWLTVSVLSGQSAYPRWTAALSPAVTAIVLRVLTRVSPPALVGVLFPATNNLSMLIFLVVSLAVT